MKQDITILQGKTFVQVLRWETAPVVYRAVTNITTTAPMTITAPGHGAPHGWRAAVTGVKGMHEANAAHLPPWDNEYHTITVVDDDTVQFNAVNAARYDEYKGGGYLQYNMPHELTGYVARMKVKDRVGGLTLASFTEADIAIDDAAKTITLTISATATAGYTWTKGIYDLEMESPTGVVTQLLHGAVRVVDEVTD
ncbi:MAG: hypothetical protein LBV29_02915 [Azoarcus sp.]|jgi:hypothetical protein|nr:hypothetical protein [Azoarcus sp.]